MTTGMNAMRIGMLVLLCLTAAACGRKGPLEPPPGSAPPPAQETQ